MEAGKLNKRITIQKLVLKAAPSGQQTGEWKDVCTVWAQVKSSNPRVINDEGVLQHEVTFKFYIRRRSDITAQMRILWNGRIFQLIGPPVDWADERTGQTLIAKELV